MIYLRRPDAFLHPQFWAEDGTDYFAPAYNHGGLSQLFVPHAGYLALANRITALAAVHLPLSWAPSLFNGVGLICQLLPALVLVSRRSEPLISSRTIRVGVALFYFALPGSFEVDVNLDNAQWHLPLAAALLLLARPAKTRAGDAFDIAILVLAGLTGPFALLLLPIAIGMAVVRRSRRNYVLLGVAAVTSIVQVISMMYSSREAPKSLGASVGSFSRIIGGRVVLGPVLGTRGFRSALDHFSGNALWVLCVLGGAAFILLVLWQSSAELRLFVLFGSLCLAIALYRPRSAAADAWTAFLAPGNGGRYFVIPMFTMLVVVGAAIECRFLLLRIGAGLFVLTSIFIGIPSDWSYPAYGNTHYQKYVDTFEHLPKGRALTFPQNPPGWRFTLIKREPLAVRPWACSAAVGPI